MKEVVFPGSPDNPDPYMRRSTYGLKFRIEGGSQYGAWTEAHGTTPRARWKERYRTLRLLMHGVRADLMKQISVR